MTPGPGFAQLGRVVVTHWWSISKHFHSGKCDPTTGLCKCLDDCQNEGKWYLSQLYTYILIICDCTSVKCDYTIISLPFDLHGSLKMHFRHQISSKISFNKYLKFEKIYKLKGTVRSCLSYFLWQRHCKRLYQFYNPMLPCYNPMLFKSML